MKKCIGLLVLLGLLLALPLMAAEAGKAEPVQADDADGTGFQLPASHSVIREEAFAGTAVREVLLPESVRKIERNAFADTPALERVVFTVPVMLRAKAGIIRAGGQAEKPPVDAEEKGPAAAFPMHRSGRPQTDEKTEEYRSGTEAAETEAGQEKEIRLRLAAQKRYMESVSSSPPERAELHAVSYWFP